MARTETPVCNFDSPAVDFSLPGTDGRSWTLQQCMGENGLLVMFICNHCPFVKAILARLVRDTSELRQHGINSVAIMSNDPEDYPEDSLEQMKVVSEKYSYPFPYFLDETQQVAKAFGAVCTPDIFGLDRYGVIQYRGRLDAAGMNDHQDLRRDLVEAMKEMVATGTIKTEQFPSMGCSIKSK